MTRQNQTNDSTAEKDYLLHGLALIGVRAVLGVENIKGSPFNVQRRVHIPNLTHDEVVYLFDWYQREQTQKIEPDVVERIWYEFKGQPGLTCWFGELLTETYNTAPSQPITMALFEGVSGRSRFATCSATFSGRSRFATCSATFKSETTYYSGRSRFATCSATFKSETTY
jgi:hypothetical protein